MEPTSQRHNQKCILGVFFLIPSFPFVLYDLPAFFPGFCLNTIVLELSQYSDLSFKIEKLIEASR